MLTTHDSHAPIGAGHHSAANDEPARVTLDAPLRWLRQGAADMAHTRYFGMAYGVVFAFMGLALNDIYAHHWQLTMGLTAGFFLMGPFVCAGIYELSRQVEHGEEPSLAASAVCWKRNPGSIGFFAAMLTFLMIIWARVSIVIFALFSTTDFPTLAGVLMQVFSFQNLEFVGVWMAVGFVFASLAFAISVVSVPMMLDRDIDTLTAAFTSARALFANPLPMYLWAALIVLLIGSSLVFGFLGLIVTAPLVGHASWHAYRELVPQR
ncbi:DUF2189 domain-containing protein [Derxia gummosa]|uniref:DUF2189 domain-containing protein n=1 Tax=Derxia gummosa DSM 723 TaxID=1121388 RepID=A0A8B6XAE1_9BURK|nr:DUF2189 domain-containing protein [Derxia gummosa]